MCKKNLSILKAPIAGIFYRRPAPEEPPYVAVGDHVKERQVVGLLETMKVFQKIRSPVNGRVVEIIAQDQSAVTDNDTLMIIEND